MSDVNIAGRSMLPKRNPDCPIVPHNQKSFAALEAISRRIAGLVACP